MKVESAQKEISDFDSRCQATTVKFNRIEQVRGNRGPSCVTLYAKNGNPPHVIGEKTFQLLEDIVTHPADNKTLANLRGLSRKTVGNEKTALFRQFGIKNTVGSPGTIRFINKLLKLGIIEYQPRIKSPFEEKP